MTGQSQALCSLISHISIEGVCSDGPERQRTPRLFWACSVSVDSFSFEFFNS